jgi:CRISPR/Cas system-associated exonuclease Cas4 (RecB family)
MGSAVHRQVARAFSLGADGIVYPKKDMLEAYTAEWNKARKETIQVAGEHATVEDFVRNGREMLERFYEDYKPFDQGTLLGVERRITFELPGTPYSFIAIVDKLWKRDDGIVEISDFKTSRSLPLGVKDPTFYSQMALYHLAVSTTYPQFEQIEVAQHFLKHGEVISYRISPEEADEYTEHLRQSVLQIVNAERLGDFPTQEGGHCNYCEYFDLCPAKRHRRVIEGEESTNEEEKTSMEAAAKKVEEYIALDSQLKSLKAEHAALKEDLVRAAKDLALTKFAGSEADVSVRSTKEEKFATKTADFQSFVDLSHLARQWQLDACFDLNTRALMKEYYKKQRLAPEQLEELKKFVVESESHRVYVRHHKTDEEDE